MNETQGQAPLHDEDYRNSHLRKGKDYDRDLSHGDFDTYMTHLEGKILSKVVSQLFPSGIPRYLDFACGTGRITQQMEPLAKASYGVDVSPSMMEQARRKCPRTTFFLRDITAEKLDIPSVNLVTAFRFFGNAQDDLRRSVLKALHGLLAHGGYLVINNHRNPGSINNRLLRLRGESFEENLSHGKLRRLLGDAGFSIERTYGIGLWMVLGRLNRPEVFSSRLVQVVEPLSRIGPMGAFCPDAVIVARRVG